MVQVLLKCNTPFGKIGETIEMDEKMAKSYGDLVEILKNWAISDDNSKNDTEQAKEEEQASENEVVEEEIEETENEVVEEEKTAEKMPKKQNKAI